MKTPTLEEVKEHFKNAKEVRCIWDGRIVNISNLNIYKDKESGFYASKKPLRLQTAPTNFYIGLFGISVYAKYAEIISYKDTKPNHYPQGYDVIDFVKDKCVNTVMNKFKIRSEEGFKKYGNYLDREDYTLSDWLEEAQQEAMDFVLYIEAIKNKLKQLR